MIDEVHANTHIREIVRNFKATKRWTGKLTVLRPPQGREYVWPFELSHKQRTNLCRRCTGVPLERDELKAIAAEGAVVDLFWTPQGWKSRVFEVQP